jgi:hypothetical protein
MIAPQPSKAPAGTNFLGETLTASRQHFRQLVASLDTLVANGRQEEGRDHLKKLEAMRVELHRLLNPNDPVDRNALTQIDRDAQRLQRALKKGWGGQAVGLLLAAVIGGAIGIVALLWGMWHFFA